MPYSYRRCTRPKGWNSATSFWWVWKKASCRIGNPRRPRSSKKSAASCTWALPGPNAACTSPGAKSVARAKIWCRANPRALLRKWVVKQPPRPPKRWLINRPRRPSWIFSRPCCRKHHRETTAQPKAPGQALQKQRDAVASLGRGIGWNLLGAVHHELHRGLDFVVAQIGRTTARRHALEAIDRVGVERCHALADTTDPGTLVTHFRGAHHASAMAAGTDRVVHRLAVFNATVAAASLKLDLGDWGNARFDIIGIAHGIRLAFTAHRKRHNHCHQNHRQGDGEIHDFAAGILVGHDGSCARKVNGRIFFAIITGTQRLGDALDRSAKNG